MSYVKISKDHPGYDRLQALKEAGCWVCESLMHNALHGCTNPECSKYPNYEEAWCQVCKGQLVKFYDCWYQHVNGYICNDCVDGVVDWKAIEEQLLRRLHWLEIHDFPTDGTASLINAVREAAQ